MSDYQTPDTTPDALAETTSETKRLTPALIGIGVGALVIGLAVGGAAGWGITTSQLQPQLDESKQTITTQDSELLIAEADLETAQKKREEAETNYTTKVEELEAREAAVQETEERIAANSFEDGMHIVNVDIQPGTYRATGSSGCYWERLSGASGNSDDRITNDLGDGDRLVTIEASDYAFTSSRCGTWTKQ